MQFENGFQNDKVCFCLLLLYYIEGSEVNKMRLLKTFQRKLRVLLLLMGIAAIFTPGVFRCSGEVGESHSNSGHNSIAVNR